MSLSELSASDWLLAVISALCVGMAKGGLAGVGMVAIVLMAFVMPARESTGAILTLLIVGDLFAVTVYRRHAVWRHVIALLPAAGAGIVSGYFLMPLVPEGGFRPFIGWLTLALLGMLAVQRLVPGLSAVAAEHPAVAIPAGWLGGVTTMLANAAGPIMTIYLLACRLPKMEFVGTAAWFFFIVNLAKVPFSVALGLIDGGSLELTLILAPVVVLGGFGGRWVLGRINQRIFEILLTTFTVTAAIRLVWK